jgi:hypothetical protein
MKAYGIPRRFNVITPDVGDGKKFAVKASKVNCRGKGGDIRNNFHNPIAKQQTRRMFARIERSNGKQQCTQFE